MGPKTRGREGSAPPDASSLAASATTQEPSSIPSKRSLPRDADDKENQDVSVQPESKRAALSNQTNKPQPPPNSKALGLQAKDDARPNSSIPQPLAASMETLPPSLLWDVTGRWEIIAAPRIANNLNISPKGCMFMVIKLTDHEPTIGRQLWATFGFGGELEGIMRFCLERSPGNELSFFEEACRLDAGVWPGQHPDGQPKWNMRWRGRDNKSNGNVTYSEDVQSEVVFERGNDGQLTMKGAMICRYMLCTFRAKKIAPGPPVKREDLTVFGLWDSYRPYHPTHYVQSRPEAQKGKPGPKLNTTRTASSNHPRRSAKADKVEPRFAETSTWDVEGNYKITKVVTHGEGFDGTGCSLKLFYSKPTSQAAGTARQLYAAFKFDSLDGIMRIAPNKARQQCHLKDFEKMYDLDPKVQPGPNNTNWLMRWRAKDGGMRLQKRVGGEIDQQTEAIFTLDVASSSSEFTSIKFFFIMEYSDNIFLIDSEKTSNLEAKCTDSTWDMKMKWLELFDSDWEDSEDENASSTYSDAESESSGGSLVSTSNSEMSSSERLAGFQRSYDLASKTRSANTSSSRAHARNPRPRPNTNVIEELPLWAWDVPGEWVVTAPRLAEKLGLRPTDVLNLRFNISNIPVQTKIRRQLWARFSSASPKAVGTFRFAPILASGEAPNTLKEFENACVLEEGYWPDPSPHGQEKWFMRWRCRVIDDVSGLEPIEGCDEHQTEVKFEEHENGELQMKGVIIYDSQPMAFEAKKLLAIPTSQGGVDSVLRLWDRHKPTSRKGRSR